MVISWRSLSHLLINIFFTILWLTFFLRVVKWKSLDEVQVLHSTVKSLTHNLRGLKSVPVEIYTFVFSHIGVITHFLWVFSALHSHTNLLGHLLGNVPRARQIKIMYGKILYCFVTNLMNANKQIYCTFQRLWLHLTKVYGSNRSLLCKTSPS